MGNCSSWRQQIVVAVPLPSSLDQWDAFSQANTFKCLGALQQVMLDDERANGRRPSRNAISRLVSKYEVEILNRTTAAHKKVTIGNVKQELQLVFAELQQQAARGKGFAKLTDVRRETALCFVHRQLLSCFRLKFTEKVDPEFINHQLQMEFRVQVLHDMAEVFEHINVDHSGAITPDQIATWAGRLYPSITMSIFIYIFTGIVATTTPFALNFAEFVGALAEFCVLNGDGIRQLVWDHLAVYKDEDDHPAVDLTKVWEMFPIDLETGARGDGMPLLKALSKLLSDRLLPGGQTYREPHLLNRREFVSFCNGNHHVFDQLTTLHKLLRAATMSHRSWNTRRRALQRAVADSGRAVGRMNNHLDVGLGAGRDVENKRRYELLPPRKKEKIYRVLLNVMVSTSDDDDDDGDNDEAELEGEVSGTDDAVSQPRSRGRQRSAKSSRDGRQGSARSQGSRKRNNWRKGQPSPKEPSSRGRSRSRSRSSSRKNSTRTPRKISSRHKERTTLSDRRLHSAYSAHSRSTRSPRSGQSTLSIPTRRSSFISASPVSITPSHPNGAFSVATSASISARSAGPFHLALPPRSGSYASMTNNGGGGAGGFAGASDVMSPHPKPMMQPAQSFQQQTAMAMDYDSRMRAASWHPGMVPTYTMPAPQPTVMSYPTMVAAPTWAPTLTPQSVASAEYYQAAARPRLPFKSPIAQNQRGFDREGFPLPPGPLGEALGVQALPSPPASPPFLPSNSRF